MTYGSDIDPRLERRWKRPRFVSPPNPTKRRRSEPKKTTPPPPLINLVDDDDDPPPVSASRPSEVLVSSVSDDCDRKGQIFSGRVGVLEGNNWGADCDYMFFLDNLREESKGFVMEIGGVAEEKPIVVNFEKSGNGSCGGFVTKTPKDVRSGLGVGCEVPGNGFVSKKPKEVGNGVEEMRSHGDSVEVMEEKIDGFCGDGGVKEASVVDGDGLVISHEVPGNGFVSKNSKASNGNNLQVDHEKMATLVGDGDDLVISCEVPGNGFASKNPKASNGNNLEVEHEKMATLVGDGGDLVINREVRGKGFVSENPKVVWSGMKMRSHENKLKVEQGKTARLVGDGDDLVISREVPGNGFVSKSPKAVRSGMKMRSHGNNLEVEQEKMARMGDGDDLVINREVCGNGFVSKNPKAVRSGMKTRSHGNNLELEQGKTARLVGDGDDLVINRKGFVSKNPKAVRSGMKTRSHGNNLELEQGKTARLVGDGDDLVINRKVRGNGFVSKTPKVVWNWVEVTNKNTRLDCDGDDKDDCAGGARSKVMKETSAGSDGDDDEAKDNCEFNSNGDGSADDKDYWVSDVEDSDVDESYKIYLSCLKEDGEVVDFTALKSRMKKNGDHCNGVADSNEKAKPSCDEGKKSQNTPLKSFHATNNGIDLSKFTDNVKFREELLEILRKPYDQEEYERLWYDISLRKPIQKHKELRGGIKIYPVDRFGKSYLDCHPDLVAEIKSVESDKRRVLNLLRGYFHWLKNLSHEGVFRPWKDSMCLEILPETYNTKASKKKRR